MALKYTGMDNELVIRFADVDDINTIGFLAQQIWPEAYGSILKAEQISYMLNLFYSPESLVDQMKKQKHMFVLAELEEEPVGFASFGPLDATGLYKLHKLYVLPNKQGKGLGKALLDFVIEEIKAENSTTELSKAKNPKAIRLGVNRFNPALNFYERLGFSKIKEEKTDIGHGFIMDDYIMELKIS
ncbi:MAG: N-acetyltransferase [Sphingobacteriales bacterium]|nr:MAG: N-acetyltransferase [Sphingobacteriales bacterium]